MLWSMNTKIGFTSEHIFSLIFSLFSDCKQPLGMENGLVKDDMITASSSYFGTYQSYHARLHSTVDEGGWCAKYNDMQQYLEVSNSC